MSSSTGGGFAMHMHIEAIERAAAGAAKLNKPLYVIGVGNKAETWAWEIFSIPPSHRRSHWRCDPNGFVWSHEPNSEERIVYERCFGIERAIGRRNT